MPQDELIALTDRQRDVLEAAAKAMGITLEEAATRLAAEAISQRFRRRAGKTPATIYPLRPRDGGRS